MPLWYESGLYARSLVDIVRTPQPDQSPSLISASTIGESPLVRYSVCLIARTRGSAAASSISRWTVVVNES